jgi:riboflavin kinase/FMN adenylyltransferase
MAKLVCLKDIERQPNSVITVGTFDGVHAGHRVLMDTVQHKAEDQNARSVIITFDPHPREIINPGDAGIKLLTTLQERREILEELGIDVLLVIPFDRDFSLLTAEEFVRDIIYQRVGVSEFVIGYDHHFGRDREGTIETVERLGDTLGFSAHVVSKQEIGEHTVSSTAIRKAIHEEGNMQKATEMLQRPYRLSGTVVHGDKRGKEIGYPTANIKPLDTRKIIPKKGVYAVQVRLEDQQFNGMMNIGQRPTFEGEGQTLEVNLFDFDSTIYGKTLQVLFIERIRDEQKFGGVDELVSQLEQDKEHSLKILEGA